MAIKVAAFMKAALLNLEPLRGTFVYSQVIRDLREKTQQVDSGYARWLATLLPWLAGRCGLGRPPRVLDFGCGSGELVVLMNVLGYDARGLDVHAAHLRLAQILAEENGLPRDRFILHQTGPLPFDDGAFDIVTMCSVFEHLSDETLDAVLPELARVCSGVLFILVPNRLKTHDDHTGLAFVNWMPRGLANLCVRISGPYHRYGISKDGSWDVYPRTYWAVRQRLERHGLEVDFVPDDSMYPPLKMAPPLYELGSGRGWKSPLLAPVRGLCRACITMGLPRQIFHSYLNLVTWRAGRNGLPEKECAGRRPGGEGAGATLVRGPVACMWGSARFDQVASST